MKLDHMKHPVFYNTNIFNFIEQFENEKTGVFRKIKSPLDGIDEVLLSHNDKDFTAKFDFDIFSRKEKNLGVGKQFKKVKFDYNRKTIVFENIFIGMVSPPFMEGSINKIYSDGYSKSKKQYYKLVIPLSAKINFLFTLQRLFYINDRGGTSILGTKTKFLDEDVFIIQETDKNKNIFLIIESRKKQSYFEFSNKTFAIRIALGYITGHFAGCKGYFFSYSNKKMEDFNHFYFSTLRDEIKTSMNPINTNPSAWMSDFRKKADKYHKSKILRPLSIPEFSYLCDTILNNENFKATLLLIIESTKASLIFRPSGYSIALETLSDIIIGDKKEKIAPILSKQDFKEFRIGLFEVLEKHSIKETFQDIKTLESRITNINQITNLESLKKPFHLLNIALLDEDLKVISSRNDFLHGRVPDFRKLGLNRSIELKDYDLYYASVRLYTLLNILILKMIGFDNYVLNFAKLFEKYTMYPVKEEFYRKV